MQRNVSSVVLTVGLSLVLASAGASSAVAGKPGVGFRNGSFDADLSGWRTSHPEASCNYGDPTVVWSDAMAVTGGAVHLNACGGDADPWISQAVSLAKGAAYRISGYVHYASDNRETFAVLIDGSAGSLVLGTEGEWIPFHVDFVASRARTTISFVGEVGLDDDCWVDDLSIAAKVN